MKIIAITEKNYDGTATKVLVEMKRNEFNVLAGTEYRSDLKLNQEFDIQKRWDDMHALRLFYNERNRLTESLRRQCDLIDNIELPKFKDEK